MKQEQQQYQGAERRQSQSQYQGEERRKPDSIFEETTWIPGGPAMSTQERKEQQAERLRQQEDKHHDQQ
jgi:hypothetical protein